MENKGWFGTKPPRQDVTCGAGEQDVVHRGSAGAYTHDKPQNPTENSHYSGCAAAVLYLSLPSEGKEEDYDETRNGDYKRDGSRFKIQ